jgi:predicted glycosyltransferase involved in capsule biosynthesis
MFQGKVSMMDFESPLITAIIPVRLSKNQLYDEPQRIWRILETLPKSYEPLIIDYGTGDERKGELASIAHQTNTKIVRVETSDRPFSIGHARDIGTQHATTPLVVYHDIDFLLSKENYERVVYEARLRGMPENAYQFFAIPGAYLTEEFTERYLSLHASGDALYGDLLTHDGVMRNDKAVFTHNTYAISAIVANRYHLLAIGGHDRSFTGHGAEDFELMHRLVSYNHRGPRTRDYYKNTKINSIQSYEGFRAYYALYGIDVFQRGIIISHLWHPRRKDIGYVGTDNQIRVSKVMQDYDKGLTYLHPLTDETSDEVTLALVKPGTSPARALRHAFPAMGRFQCISDAEFEDAESLIDFVESEGITRVFFLNPYGNEHRLALYKEVKARGIPLIVYDRGALNNSWFFDPSGFLGESNSYDPSLWDKPLSEEDRTATSHYVDKLRSSSDTLEKNGDRIGAVNLRSSYGIGDRKVLFVALQRPSDTATVYFSGPCKDAHHFNEWIRILTSTIDKRRYAVVVKKHPLETERPDLHGAIFVKDDTHINDLIELADKVIVINSGTGLIAAALGTAVICCGNAFYAHPGIAHQATSADELLNLSTQNLGQDRERVFRFMKYLLSDFYSFAKTEYIEKAQADGSLRRIARKATFSELRGIGERAITLGEIPVGISLDAPLFYSYGGRAGVAKKAASAAVAKHNVSLLRRPLKTIARPVVRRIGNKQDLRDFDSDPARFFAKLKNPWYRGIGAVLFPLRNEQ